MKRIVVPLLLVGAAFLLGEVLLPVEVVIAVVALAAGEVDPRLAKPQMVCGLLIRTRIRIQGAEVNLILSNVKRQVVNQMILNVKSPFSIPLPVGGCLAASAGAWAARETDPWVTQVITEGYRIPW